MDICEIPTPAIIVDRVRVQENIRKMGDKAKTNNVSLRPHIKTHKCIEIGKLQKSEGAEGITVATLSEAKVFSDHGFNDITYAVPLSDDKIKIATELNSHITLNVMVDNSHLLQILSNKAQESQKEINVLVKVDCGYHRTGIDPSDQSSVNLVETISDTKWLNFKGILTHAGHSYSATSIAEIESVTLQEQEEMIQFAEKLREKDAGLYPEVISIGSTPTLTVDKDIPAAITEIRPGSYVYFDYTQVKLGSCGIADCSFSLLASIVSKQNNRLVIDAGATALSKDVGPTHIEPDCGFGKFYADYKSARLDSASAITGLSQEHGKVAFGQDSFLTEVKLDEKLRILPNHSCLTNNLFNKVYVVEDERVVDIWKIHQGHNLD
ncbi:MAG: alanine racemase [Candidatus Thorarchaeota archaeon]|nr:alanine racemase [Candidatus Thorarchaeota archaeon]